MSPSHPEKIIVHKQETFEATGVVQDHRLRTQTTVHGLICPQANTGELTQDLAGLCEADVWSQTWAPETPLLRSNNIQSQKESFTNKYTEIFSIYEESYNLRGKRSFDLVLFCTNRRVFVF